MSADNFSDVLTRVSINTNIEEPKKYNVIYYNDNVTSYEFVIISLMSVFGYDEALSVSMAVSVNDNGYGIVATLNKELADQSVSEVVALARQNNFPLVVKAEPVS